MDYKDMKPIGLVRLMLTDGVITQEQAAKYFPELKESEDEKIRKALTDYFKWNPNGQLLNEFSNREVFAWLEKQGEKDEEILILKDQIESLHAAIKALKEAHKIELEKQSEQKTEHQQIVKNLQDNSFRRMFEQKPVEWSEEDKDMLNQILHYLDFAIYSHTDSAIIDDCKHWLKSLKDRAFHISQQEWSEEDVAYLNIIIEDLKELYKKRKADPDSVLGKSQRDNIDWLKSRLSQKRSNVERTGKNWKPSDQELGAILVAIGDEKQKGSDVAKELQNIYQQLKKLKAL